MPSREKIEERETVNSEMPENRGTSASTRSWPLTCHRPDLMTTWGVGRWRRGDGVVSLATETSVIVLAR
jgi:hypothetical protein